MLTRTFSCMARLLGWLERGGVGLLMTVVLVTQLLVIGLTLNREGFIFSDEAKYDGYARSLHERGVFEVRAGGEKASVTPGYPMVLAGVYAIFGADNYPAARSVSALLNAVGVYFVYLFARRAFGRRGPGLVVAWGFALHPYYWRILGLAPLLSDPLFILLFGLALCLWLIAYTRPERGLGLGLVLGLILAIAMLVKTWIQFLPAVLLAYEVWRLIRARKMLDLRAWAFGAGLAVALTVVVAPWLWRNYRHLGLTSMTSSTGLVIYSGTSIQYNGDYGLAKAATADLRLSLSEGDYNRLMTEWAVRNLREGGFGSLVLALKQTTRFWLGLPARERPSLLSLVVLPFTILLLGMAGVGLAQRNLPPTLRAARELCLLTLVYSTIVYFPVTGDPRYSLPLLPLVLVFGWLGVQTLWQRLPTAARLQMLGGQ